MARANKVSMPPNRHESGQETVYFVTTNPNKFEEVSLVLSEYGIPVSRLDMKRLEIQADSVEEIATTSVAQASRSIALPHFVEDAGLFIEALNGFPGPYSAYVHKKLGIAGILTLMQNIHDRRAEFRSSIAASRPGGQPVCFLGVSQGTIVEEARGTHGFGFDPIFEPDGGGGRTFGEMTVEEKGLYSHRARATREFARWYLQHSPVVARPK